MKVYSPKDAKCQKCGGPLGFRLLKSGKWCPCNPDGSDRWDDCSEAQSKGTYGIKRDIVKWLFIGLTIGKNYSGSPYSGVDPPWD